MSVSRPKKKRCKSLKVLKDRYEAHHKVQITDEAIESAVKLSSRYIADRYLPDKAIDLVDEAASRVRLRTFTAPEDLQEMEKRIKEVEIDKAAAVNEQDFERAAELRDKQKALTDELEQKKNEWAAKNERSNSVVKAEDIAEIVAMWTGIPVGTADAGGKRSACCSLKIRCTSVSSVRTKPSRPLQRPSAAAESA